MRAARFIVVRSAPESFGSPHPLAPAATEREGKYQRRGGRNHGSVATFSRIMSQEGWSVDLNEPRRYRSSTRVRVIHEPGLVMNLRRGLVLLSSSTSISVMSRPVP